MSQLNESQQRAGEFFLQNLFDDSVREIAITGGAGYGKTFLMGHMIDTLLPQYMSTCELLGIKPRYKTVVMTATTNKAAEVLSRATKRPTSTIHSFMNLTIESNYSTGETKLKKSKSWTIHEDIIIIIDEGYTVDSQLYRYLHEGTKNCLIVYVGDKDQMNPVKEKISPVADPKNNIASFELTIPVRNADVPALAELSAQLKNTVETTQFGDILLVPGAIEFLSDDEAVAKIEEHFKDQNPHSRILTYTNKRAIQFNDYIRGLRNLGHEYTEGEYLVSCSAIRTSNGTGISIEDIVCIESLHPPMDVFVEDDEEYPITVRPAVLSKETSYETVTLNIPVDRQYALDLMAYFRKAKMWRHFFWLKNNIPDLRPTDACTVYKAQGSTLDTVFIDLSDLSSRGVPDNVARMLYVAASRARRKVYFFGELKEKFGKLRSN